MIPPILVTGFQPFGPHDVNPSALLAERLAGEDGVVTAVLPVAYDECGQVLASLIDQHQPMAVLCFGLSERSDFVLIERIAWNRDESPHPDNRGVVREDEAIIPDGPAAYGAGMPVPAMVRALSLAGMPVTASDHAGGFVCNHLFYRARHLIETQDLDLPMAFIHLPPLPEQVAGQFGRQGMTADRQAEVALTLIGLLKSVLATPAP